MNTRISKRCNSLHNARRLKGQLQNATALSICPPRHPESVVSPSMYCCAPSNTRAWAQCPRTVKCACSGGNQQEPHCTEYCAGVNLQRRPAQKVRPQTLHCTRASPSGECVVHQAAEATWTRNSCSLSFYVSNLPHSDMLPSTDTRDISQLLMQKIS